MAITCRLKMPGFQRVSPAFAPVGPLPTEGRGSRPAAGRDGPRPL